jgi:glycosyltransferase involved in cell wall biosynthesis
LVPRSSAAKAGGGVRVKVLAIVPSVYDTSPGQRFRIEQWEPLLRERGIQIEYAPFEDDDLHAIVSRAGNSGGKVKGILSAFSRRRELMKRLREFDLVYVFREAALLGPPWFEREIAASGIPVVFDFDDAIFVSYVSPSNGYLSYLKFAGKTAEICKLSTHVMAGNPYLADYATRAGGTATIIPTTIDTNKYRPESTTETKAGGLTIGWSGSFSTVQHLDTLRNALQQLAKTERFKLRVIGTPNYSLAGVDVEALPWRAATEVQDLRQIDIGIMPLPDDDWSKGKCGLKALQYMALGIPTICSPVGVNTDIIQDGMNGMLASSDAEWNEKLTALLRSPKMRLQLGTAGRKTVEENYSAVSQAPRVAKIFEEAVARRGRSASAD